MKTSIQASTVWPDDLYTFDTLCNLNSTIHRDEDMALVIDDTFNRFSKKAATPGLLFSPHPHSHNYIELAYTYAGTGIHHVNGIRFTVQKGDILCMNLEDCHYYEPLENLQVLNCVITRSALKKLSTSLPASLIDGNRLNLPIFTRMDAKNYLLIEQLFLGMQEDYLGKKDWYMESLRAKLTVILLEILRTSACAGLTPTLNSTMWLALEYISKHYLEDVHLQDVAQVSGYSPSYFSRLFHEYMGISFIKYVNNLKINKAKSLLATTNLTVDEVCRQSGFKEKKNFYQLFREDTQFTPKEFRNAINAATE